MIRVAKCPICNSEDLEVIKKSKFHFPGENVKENLVDTKYVRLWILFERILKDRKPVEFDSTLCKSCGLIFMNPRFTAEEILIKYDAINELGSVKYRLQQKPLPNSIRDMRAKRIYSLISGLQENEDKSRRILDYGGASGYNLIPFVSGNSCYILDYEKWTLPKSIEYLGADLADLQTDELFDVILLCHTLEHVIEPSSMINELSAHLTEGGFLYVEVPLGCFQEWKHLRDPITHINFFSEESLLKCLWSIGLDVIHLSTAYQRGVGWCIYIVGKRSPRTSNIPPRFKSTKQQASNLYYYLPMIRNKILNLAYNLIPGK